MPEQRKQSRARKRSSPGVQPPRLTVLLVDDEPAANLGMRALLARDPHVEIVGEANDGHHAIHLIKELLNRPINS